ncbi:hypothetical protein HL657_05520 [Methanoculleus sp. YWC-01]|jgi:hypothetical protein|uniref:Uncharacterized protein n=1 Tax=Methanoculleus nereidis TaxID=2735141 RepID=A0ABU3Z1E2_9EURY|nr:hypothetical protein [Methanoculleus sp. YWC-01]MDV4342637.1 hypothetical protein [Methanoculleus sp. YWC-01]
MRTLSSNTIFPALLIMLGICMLAAGCTSDTSPTETTPYETSSVATTAPAAGTTVSGAAEGSISAVPFATLISYLPGAPAGWTADEPAGATWTVEDGQWTWASRDYSKGDARATVLIQDSAYYNVGYWESWDSLVAFETTEGYYKSGTVSGHPSWEVFSKPDSYGTWVGVNERFMVYVSVEGGSEQDLNAFVNAIDYGGIANLE